MATFPHHHEECMLIMEQYYSMIYDGLKYFICPTCQSVENGMLFNDFYSQHKQHLSQFMIRKKDILINKLSSGVSNNMDPQSYYSDEYNGKRYYVCPSCQTAENILYNEFMAVHSSHLTTFTTTRKNVILRRQ